MNGTLREIYEVNALRLAHEFLATIAQSEQAALKLLRIHLSPMKEWEIRLWIDYLGDLIVAEEVPPHQLHSIFNTLELLDTLNRGSDGSAPSIVESAA